MTIYVYTDGASKNNPGEAGSGAVLFKDGEKIKEISKYLGIQTNNYAEYMAVLLALDYLIKNDYLNEKIVIHSDSQLVVNQLNGAWKIKNENIKQIFNEVFKRKSLFTDIEFKYIPRSKNKYADSLANKAIRDRL